ncbi:efflux RND transporter permease subunit [Allosediminivita pacifica]|uniref:Efflux pump membrane transporter n=1 Tax=Allosediminivita pacifica TaxID=1267769 RepID=A0A2T6B7R6_9RHOB|nr:efflux RND transporter permease subunit [Allosediminivita pacifica]PTX52078.1 multidrug efflux pump [Allosediminivita pacifica]GGA97331.1 multidrug efflux RND transporter permease subunit [Allosediminivita pacifica]
MGLFFIQRPVFAWVLAIVTMLAGVWSYLSLPVSQYPDIAPTTVRISATYSGATASAVENSVTRVIEDALTGLDGMIYMTSQSSEGSSSISLTFDESVDPVDAQNEVQTKVSQVEGQLPTSVQSRGVSVSRSTSSILMIGALVAPDGGYTTLELGDILSETVEGPIERADGVGGINSFNSGYAMRIWLDPIALARYQMTATDVVTAVENQNTTVSVGSLGDLPTVAGQQFTATITAQSQLSELKEFEEILLRSSEDGGIVRLADVATIEIGQEDYGGGSRFDGAPAAGFGINLKTGANAVDTSTAAEATLDQLSASLPAGVEFRVAYDTSPFVELSIEQVYHTIFEAIVLVFLVLVVFLQSWRATVIPLIAVPVVLLGTFAVLYATGFSINTLTMFAMVLSIGLLVDDAIVVVENVERLMETEGMSALDATRASMTQIASALLGINVVLAAVFLPMAFFGGSTGVIYRQFSLTMVTAMTLSLLVALILSPPMSARLLKPKTGQSRFPPARWFNAGMERVTAGYGRVVRLSSRAPILLARVLAVVLGGSWALYQRIDGSFIPTEDQGVLMTMVSLPEGATAQQTLATVEKVEAYLLEDEMGAVEATLAALGLGFSGNGQNSAMIFVKLRDFEERSGDASLSAANVAARANQAFMASRAGSIRVMQPPAIMGLGNSGGFSMYLIDQAGNGTDALRAAAVELERIAGEDDRLTNVSARNTEDSSALRIDIDREKAESFGVSLSSVNAMLTTIFSGSEVNDFILGSSLRPVIVQAAAEYRMQPEGILRWYAVNSDGEIVPFSAFVTTSWEAVAPSLQRYGGTSALEISGSAANGVSSGTAMDAMEELASSLDGGYGVAWTGISYQERQSGNQAPVLYAISALVVFLALAALYESWSIPFSVMLAVPVGILGALAAAWLFGQSNDVYFKVGMLTTIGLAARNAILIVEFAEDLRREGRSIADAAVEAARLRLRPILMTALTFILGVLPLATASGAGAAAQRAIGTGVIGGMIASTFIGIFMVPGLYLLIMRLVPTTDRTKAVQ